MNARLRRSKTSLRKSWVADYEWTPHSCACIESTLEHLGRREWPLRILSAWRLREVLKLCSRVALHVYSVSVAIWEDIFMILRALARAVRAQSLCCRVIWWSGELRGEWCEISVSLLPSYLMVGGYWAEASSARSLGELSDCSGGSYTRVVTRAWSLCCRNTCWFRGTLARAVVRAQSFCCTIIRYQGGPKRCALWIAWILAFPRRWTTRTWLAS
jgi:hypothetical protein